MLETLMFELVLLIDSMHAAASMRALQAVETAIAAFGCTDKSNRGLVASCAALKYYRFFLDSVLLSQRRPSARRFLDGTFGVSLFEGSYGIGPRDLTRFQRLAPAEVLLDRKRTAHKIAHFDNTQLATRVAHYAASDVPHGVGTRVAAFVGRCRLLTQQCGQRPANACVCGRCGRRILRLEAGTREQGVSDVTNDGVALPTQQPANEIDSDDSDDSDDEVVGAAGAAGAAGFWRSISLDGGVSTLPAIHLCSRTCELKYEEELILAAPFTCHMLEEAEDGFDRIGRKPDGVQRVVVAFRAAVKRHGAVTRHLREARRAHRALATKALTDEAVERLHKQIIDVMNVDLALLYAAEALAQSPSLAYGRVLPGATMGWRHAHDWSSALAVVKRILRQHETGGSVRYPSLDLRCPPRWLRRVVEQAETLFPRKIHLRGLAGVDEFESTES